MDVLKLLCFLSFLLYCDAGIWHSYRFNPNHENREEINITSVSSVNDFELNLNVSKWVMSLTVGDLCYAAGLSKSGFVVTKFGSNPSVYHESLVTNLDQKIIDIAIFEHWNETVIDKFELIVVVALQNEIAWFRFEDSDAVKFWSWPLSKEIISIKTFQLQYDNHLQIISKLSSKISLDIYHFDINIPNFWLRQTIPLETPARSTAISAFGPDYFLTIPQKNILLFYKMSPSGFLSFQNISSDDVTDVTSFTVGHKSFLAVNGHDAGIYRFSKEGIVRDYLEDLFGVNYWLPIPLPSYHSEIILIGQRRLDHGLHNSSVIEVITYNGVKFDEHEDIPCNYFGEHTNGLTCLPREDVNGIQGSVPIILDDKVALLIPRNDNSDLFMINIAVRKHRSPAEAQVEAYRKHREYLEGLIKEQQKELEELKSSEFVRKASEFETVKSQLANIDSELAQVRENITKIKSFEDSGRYKTIIFNGVVEAQGKAEFKSLDLERIGNKSADEVLQQLKIKDQIDRPSTSKKILSLETEELFFKIADGINASDLLFTNENITINGNVVIQKPLKVKKLLAEKINGKILENEIVDFHDLTENLVFEDVNVIGDVFVDKINNVSLLRSQAEVDWSSEIEALIIPQNISVGDLNGESFDKFLDELCMKNIDTRVPGTTIMGNVRIEKAASIRLLNGLKFPEDYVFREGEVLNITGEKIFSNVLVSELYSPKINGVNILEVITLSLPQEIPSTTTFENLEVTESLDVNGHVTGEIAAKFLPNPTLSETNLVKANVNFKNLEVEGSIILKQNYNGTNFESILSEIVYKNEETPVINGVKHFPEGFTVRKNLEVTSNRLSDFDLDNLVTKHTNQVLNFTTINGTVNFDNLQVTGLYNFTDVKKLDEEVVKLTGHQFISSTLVFENDLEVNNFEVLDDLQGEEATEFVPENITFSHVLVEGKIRGRIRDFDIEEFDRNRLSFTKDQVLENYEIDRCYIENLEVDMMNNVEFEDFDEKRQSEKIKELLERGKIAIDNLHVKGSVHINNVNGEACPNLAGALWKNSFHTSEIEFQDNVYFEEINIEKLSGVNFTIFKNNLVFKNESVVKFSSNKTFTNGFTVQKLIETEKINGIFVSEILTKQGRQEILTPVVIRGNVSIGNATVLDNINEMPVELLENYKIEENNIKIDDEVMFNRLVHINNLEINGLVDEEPVEGFLQSLIYINEDFALPGLTTFQDSVVVEKNLKIRNRLNEIDFEKFVSNVVLTTKDASVKAGVKFLAPITIENQVNVNGDLQAQTVNGLDIRHWMQRAIFIYQGLIEGNFIFQNAEIHEKLVTDFLNDINMTTLVPLQTKQNISYLSFGQIASIQDILVGNLTNSYFLPKEFNNTVFTNLDQKIESPLEFFGKIFAEEVVLAGLLNDLKTDKIVTTSTDQNLNSTYKFKSKATMEGDLTVDGLVSGINITKWEEESMKTSSIQAQDIDKELSIEGELSFEEDVQGVGMINGFDLRQLQDEVQQRRKHKLLTERIFIDNYTNICKDLTYMHEKMKRQIYKFNYLEDLQPLEFHSDIRFVFNFQLDGKFYLLIGEEDYYDTHLFIFDGISFRSSKDIFLGSVTQIISVPSDNSIFFVTVNEDCATCNISGTNIWQFQNDELTHVFVIEDQDILQDSIVPDTFYGKSGNIVSEFNIIPGNEVRIYRKWQIEGADIATFVPRGLGTGLALKTGTKLIKLDREEPVMEDDPSIETQITIQGTWSEEYSLYLPENNDFIVVKVGTKSSQRNLLAVGSHEETSVQGSIDFIKIYEDVITGKLFHKVPSYKPSSVVSLQFNNGETILAFMEDESVLQLYEYKGIEGFKFRSSAKMEGSKLFTLNVAKKNILGVVHRNRVSLIEAAMIGNQVEENLDCSL